MMLLRAAFAVTVLAVIVPVFLLTAVADAAVQTGDIIIRELPDLANSAYQFVRFGRDWKARRATAEIEG